MKIDFNNRKFFEHALKQNKVNYENNLTAAGAFFLLIKNVDFDIVDNLCDLVGKRIFLENSQGIYQSFSSPLISPFMQEFIINCAYDLIHNGVYLGTKTGSDYNASSWISHCLYEGEVASNLARAVGLNPDTAMKLGMLHDIGRKFDHSFMHTIKGYEYLCVLGYPSEAVCCLTHSFLSSDINGSLRGNRCANCDPALEGFYINEEGQGVFKEDHNKDEIAKFLDQYEYNLYDVIINVADLMASSKGVLYPHERVTNIYKRKYKGEEPDPINQSFFKISFINNMKKLLFLIEKDEKDNVVYNVKDMSGEEIDKIFVETSNEFMEMYNRIKDTNNNTMKQTM